MSRLRDFSNALTRVQLVGLTAGFAAVCAALVVMALHYTGAEYVVVYNGQSESGLRVVSQRLEVKGVPYRVNGGALSVPDTALEAARREIESSGIVRAPAAGFEIFDKPGFFVPEFTQRLNYSRALSGELARSINEIDGVIEARVHLVLPPKGIFGPRETDAKAASAAVILRLKPGVLFTRAQAGAVAAIVAAGAPDMKIADVTVADTSGSLLAGPGVAALLENDKSVGKTVEAQERLKVEMLPVEAVQQKTPVRRIDNGSDLISDRVLGYALAGFLLAVVTVFIILRVRRKAVMLEVEAELERLLSQKAVAGGIEGRELIELRAVVRRDPAAAARVLEEWVAQG